MGSAGKNEKADTKEPPPPPPVPPAMWPGPRPRPRPTPLETPPWGKPIADPPGKPEERAAKLAKELAKDANPQLDKCIGQLASNDFNVREAASQQLEKLLKEGGTAALAHCVNSYAQANDSEVSRRLELAIKPHVSAELSIPSFGEWRDDSSGRLNGIPQILHEVGKTPGQQAERSHRLDVLSTFLRMSDPSRVKEMNIRLGEYEHLKEIRAETESFKAMHLTNISDKDLEVISKICPNLTKVEIDKSPSLAEKGLHHLKGLEQLHSLELYGTPVSEKGLTEIASIPNLKVLSISLGQLTNERLGVLAKCGQLEALHLPDNPGITDAGLKHLAGLQNLEELKLDRTSISNKFLSELPQLAKLELLSLKGTKVGAENLAPEKVLNKLPELSVLVVGDHVPQDKLEQLQSQYPEKVRVGREGSRGY